MKYFLREKKTGLQNIQTLYVCIHASVVFKSWMLGKYTIKNMVLVETSVPLLSLGTNIVSIRVKKFLRKYRENIL